MNILVLITIFCETSQCFVACATNFNILLRLQTMAHCNCIKSLCLDRLSKTLKPGSIPTINLPMKSREESKPSTSRRVIEKKELVPSKVYKDINDLISNVSKLVLKGWSRKDDDDACILDYFDGKHALPLYSVKIDSSLGLTVAAFG